MKKIAFTFLMICCLGFVLQAQTTSEAASVKLSAGVTFDPPSATIVWEPVQGVLGYLVYKKNPFSTDWGMPNVFPPTSNGITDSSVDLGERWEYRVIGIYPDTSAAVGHIQVAVASATREFTGNMLLVVDSTFKNSLATEIQQLEDDYVGDGYTVFRLDVGRDEAPQDIKARIQTLVADNTDPNNPNFPWYMNLLGHVPVPYSGDWTNAPDGHPEHGGAWPTDQYYAVFDGNWTDSRVNNTTPARVENQNIPGDGKFDPTIYPAVIRLRTGRVDFADMPGFADDEEELLRKYLNKLHAYKSREIVPTETAIIDDNFQTQEEGFAQNGWKNFGPLVGINNISAGDYITELSSTPHLWSYGCGPGSYTSAGGIGTFEDFANNDLQGIFTMLFGSYFGDWDNQNNLLRASIAGGNSLASIWSGRPHSYLHMMGTGETLGEAYWLSQMSPFLANPNDPAGLPLYSPSGAFTAGLHQSLMGDPSLRNRYAEPATNITSTLQGSTLDVNWTASTGDPAQVYGYFVATSSNRRGPYRNLSTQPITATNFTIDNVSAGDFVIVRTVKLEITPSGAYFNFSVSEVHQVGGTEPLVITTTGTNPVCNGGTDGTATVNVTGGLPPYNYAWSNGGTTATISDLAAGTYEIVVTDSNMNSESGQVTLTQPDPILLNLTTTDVTGVGNADGTATVAPAGGTPPYTITWSTGPMNATTTTGLIPELYLVTVTDDIGCLVQETFTINDFSCPTILSDVSVVAPRCAGDNGLVEIMLTGAMMPVNYDSGAPGSYASGTYTFSGTDASGCPFNGSFEIPTVTPIVANITVVGETGPNRNDGTATVNPSGGTPPYMVSWSDGQSGNTATDLSPGDYTNVITDANDCSFTTTFTINGANCNLMTTVDVNHPRCSGEQGTVEIIVTGGAAPYTFDMNGSGSYDAGNYQFSGTDADGCAFSGSFMIESIDAIVANISVSDETAPNQNNGTASVNPSGGTPPYMISWSGGQSGNSVSNLAPGDYSVVITDGNDCSLTTTFTVNDSMCNLMTDVMVEQPKCAGEQGEVVITITGGTPPYNFAMNGSGMYDAGDYQFSGTDANGCDFSGSFTIDSVTDETPPTITGQGITVALDNSGMATIIANQLVSVISDDCSVNVTVTADIESFSCDNLGENMVTLTAVDGAGNPSMTTVIVTVVDETDPEITCPANVTVNACEVTLTEIATATDNCGATVFQSGGPSIIEPITSTSDIEFTATDDAGNDATCVFTVTVMSDLAISGVNTNNVDCITDNGNAEILIVGGNNSPQISWSTGETGSSISGLAPGDYSVTVREDGCELTSTFTIDDLRTNPNATATVTALDDGTGSGAVSGSATNGDAPFMFEWTDANGNTVGTTPDLSGLPAGEYTLVVTDANGCTGTITVVVDMTSSVYDKVFPGTFKAFPNPTADFLNLEIKLNSTNNINWEIYNGRGQLMKVSPNDLRNSVFEKIDISNLASGIYLLTVRVENERFFKKIMVE